MIDEFVVTSSPIVITGNFTQTGILNINTSSPDVTVNGCVTISGQLNINLEEIPTDGEYLEIIKINSSCQPIGEFSNIKINVVGGCPIQGKTERLTGSIGIIMNMQCGKNSKTWWIVIIIITCIVVLVVIIGVILAIKNEKVNKILFPFAKFTRNT